MSNSKITSLPEAGSLVKTDLFAVVQGEAPNFETRRTTFGNLLDSIGYYTSEESGEGFGYNWKLKTTVLNGLEATFEIEFTTDGFRSFSIPNIIPQNFFNKKWFKINLYMSIIESNSVTDAVIIPMEGTISTTAGNPIITGVGTKFGDLVYNATQWEILDANMNQIGNPNGTNNYDKGVWFGLAPHGVISDTQIDVSLMGASRPSVSLVNSQFFLRPVSGRANYDFGYARFNNLINSHDNNPATAFHISGALPGEFCQYDGQVNYATNSQDQNPINLGNFGGYFSQVIPKNISEASLDFDYRANKTYGAGIENGFPFESAPGSIKLILQGYLL